MQTDRAAGLVRLALDPLLKLLALRELRNVVVIEQGAILEDELVIGPQAGMHACRDPLHKFAELPLGRAVGEHGKHFRVVAGRREAPELNCIFEARDRHAAQPPWLPRNMRLAGGRAQEGDAWPLGAPADWNPETMGHCSTLWVRSDIEGGVPFLRSAWEVEAQEAGWMLAGAKLQLGVCAPQHPVVNLGLGPIPDTFLPPLTVQQNVTTDGQRAARVTMYLPGGKLIFAEVLLLDEYGLPRAVGEAISSIEDYGRQEGLLSW